MNNEYNKRLLNIITLLILIGVPMLRLISMFFEKTGILNDYDSINPAVIIFALVPFLIYLYIYDFIKNKRKIEIYDILTYILIIAGVLVCIFSIEINISIFGKSYRHEGFLTLLGYYLILLNWKNYGTKKDFIYYKKVIYIILFINAIYSILQLYTKIPCIVKFANDYRMASGLCFNPNFLGSLIVTGISMLTCELLLDKKISFIKYIFFILLFITLINCQSTGPMLAYIVFLIFIIGFFILKKLLNLKKLLLILITLPITFITVYYINIYTFRSTSGAICEMCNIKTTISTGGTSRLEIWGKTLKIIEKNWLLGVGYDNLESAYPNPKIENSFVISITAEKKPKRKIVITDNAHNVYLHTLVSGGIITLAPYLILCLSVFIKGLKTNNKMTFIFLSGFISYSIQAFVNISVIQVAPIYYLIIGLILSYKE